MSGSDLWQRAEEIFDLVVDAPESERSALLDRECAGDDRLRVEVEGLLRADVEAGDFLDGDVDQFVAPLLQDAALAEGDDPDVTQAREGGGASTLAAHPEFIGEYQILGKLGEGGMGIVYEALQTNPKRNVALKVIQGGRYVTENAVRMFKREAETLGRLKHPGIAAIYESGRTKEGQHFFAMELVQGVPLDAHLGSPTDPLSGAEVDRRLTLFRRVADAVHYAHQRGVIHRDLKPSNVVVPDPVGETSGSDSGSFRESIKVLDFGLSRITEEAESSQYMTQAGVKGTLAYMSPEQARGNPDEVDLRTDVYALGVMLFEMLATRRPHDLSERPMFEAVRTICDEPPAALGQFWRGTRKLDPDLETIVGKALEKDPDRRYASVAAFADDVERFQNRLPILARPPSATYQLRKLVERNKLAAGFTAALALLVVGFGVAMSFLWQQSERARSREQAARLVALGRVEIDENPTVALAHAIASIEAADDPVGRAFALEALARGPVAESVWTMPTNAGSFSPDGRFLAINRVDFGAGLARLELLGERGEQIAVLNEGEVVWKTWFSRDSSEVLAHVGEPSKVKVFSTATGEMTEEIVLPERTGRVHYAPRTDTLLALAFDPTAEAFRAFRSRRGEGRWEGPSDFTLPFAGEALRTARAGIDSRGDRFAHVTGDTLDIVHFETGERTIVSANWGEGRGEGAYIPRAMFSPDDELLAVLDIREIEIWRAAPNQEAPVRAFSCDFQAPIAAFGPHGVWFAAGDDQGTTCLMDLESPENSRPVKLQLPEQEIIWNLSFHPSGRTLASSGNSSGAVWQLDRNRPVSMEFPIGADVWALTAHPEGEWVIALTPALELLPLRSSPEMPRGVEFYTERTLDLGPEGKKLVGAYHGALVVDLETGERELFQGFEGQAWTAIFSPDGTRVAASGGQMRSDEAHVVLWDLATRESQTLSAGDGEWVVDLLFPDDDHLFTSGRSGIRLWDLETETFEVIDTEPATYLALNQAQTLLAAIGIAAGNRAGDRVTLYDLETGEKRVLEAFDDDANAVAFHPIKDWLATGHVNGTVRMGPVDGSEPYLLLGHRGNVISLEFLADGRLLSGASQEVRIWSAPAGPPQHLQPRDELLAQLKALTNYRVVADETEDTGFRTEIGAFRGWAPRGDVAETND